MTISSSFVIGYAKLLTVNVDVKPALNAQITNAPENKESWVVFNLFTQVQILSRYLTFFITQLIKCSLPDRQTVRISIRPGSRLPSIGIPSASIAQYTVANVVAIVIVCSVLKSRQMDAKLTFGIMGIITDKKWNRKIMMND